MSAICIGVATSRVRSPDLRRRQPRRGLQGALPRCAPRRMTSAFPCFCGFAEQAPLNCPIGLPILTNVRDAFVLSFSIACSAALALARVCTAVLWDFLPCVRLAKFELDICGSNACRINDAPNYQPSVELSGNIPAADLNFRFVFTRDYFLCWLFNLPGLLSPFLANRLNSRPARPRAAQLVPLRQCTTRPTNCCRMIPDRLPSTSAPSGIHRGRSPFRMRGSRVAARID